MSAGGLVWPDYAAIEADGYAVADDPNVARIPHEEVREALRRERARLAVRPDDESS